MSDRLPSPLQEPRITTSEVCAIARLSPVTIQRRIAAGKLPKAIDRGREQIFDRRAIYEALGISILDENNAATEENPWERAAGAIAERRTAALHDRH